MYSIVKTVFDNSNILSAKVEESIYVDYDTAIKYKETLPIRPGSSHVVITYPTSWLTAITTITKIS